ncbi:MAG: heparinase II/III family protein [Polyangiaceae bacterium]
MKLRTFVAFFGLTSLGLLPACKRHFVSPFDKDPGPAPSFSADGLPPDPGGAEGGSGADVAPGAYKGLGGNGSASPQDDRDATPVPDPAPGTWPHPRILVRKETIPALKARAKDDNPVWHELESSCNEAVAEKTEAGYESEDWAHAATNLAMCALVTDNPKFAKAAVRYAVGLVEDAQKLGDGKGGEKMVEHADGYSIRHRGVAPALVYDWLYGNPALTDAAKKKIVTRLYGYGKWYRKAGYRNSDAIGNHYMGHFASIAASGAAFAGDDPRAAELRGIARKMWKKEVIPAYTALAGGDFPEGFQYARTIATSMALYVDAESRAPGGNPKLADELPWLRETLAFQIHATHPEGRTMHDSADWSEKPAKPNPAPYFAISVAHHDPVVKKRALSLARATRNPEGQPIAWLELLADDPKVATDELRQGPLSHLSRGTGTFFARTDWAKTATWVSLQASPLWADHQHSDQGHFEVVRGGDLLFTDPGDYDSNATSAHNCILVDDAGENMEKTPNQAIYGQKVGMRRFEDTGRFVYGEVEYSAAYDAPHDSGKARSVTRAERAVVVSRASASQSRSPGAARVVVYDRVTVRKGSYGVTFAIHPGAQPKGQGAAYRVDAGASSAELTALLPKGTTFKLVKEPSIKTDDIFKKDDPAKGMLGLRLENASPKGATERRFLHVIASGGSGDGKLAAEAVEGKGVDGARLDNEAYLFTKDGPQAKPAEVSYEVSEAATTHVVTGLAPKGHYSLAASKSGASCKVSLKPEGALVASAAGTVTLTLAPGCAAKAP